MVARGLLCRLAADAPTIRTKTSEHNFVQLARLLQPSTTSHNRRALAYRPALVQYRRSYATAAAVKAPAARKPAATKPTATVKRAVKATAAAKKAPAKTKVTAKKPAAKTPAAKKPAPKKKPAAKKKPVAKKAPKRVKKVTTPEEDYKAQTRKLNTLALRSPKPTAVHAWQVFVAEAVKGSSKPPKETVTNAGSKYKALTPAEIEHYNHLANEVTAAKKATYQAWVESHTPEEISVANRARSALRRRHKQSGGKGLPAQGRKIDDPRAKKRVPAFLLFSNERRATGDFKSIKAKDSSKLIGEEWKALSENERQKYRDVANAASKATT